MLGRTLPHFVCPSSVGVTRVLVVVWAASLLRMCICKCAHVCVGGGGDWDDPIIINVSNSNNKRPLTPKSMPPAGDEHAKLEATNTNARRKGKLEINKDEM